MGIVSLPLHIWDRELDSRILLSALVLSHNHQVILGHEHNISPIYKNIRHIFHYGAGRPVFNEPRTNQWYEPIIANGGFNGLVFEEGVNDIMLNSSMSFPGINSRSVASTSKVFAWCAREVDQMVAAAPHDLASNLRNISTPCSNTRIDILGEIGNHYFAKYIESISAIYGEYVLISDNFGLEIFGVGGPLDAASHYKYVTDKKKRKEMLEFDSMFYERSKLMRDGFCRAINQFVRSNPRTNFIFRPHPVADPLYWHQNLAPSRNLTILCRDNPVPWLKAAKAVIHAGCTLGLEAELAGVPAIDITAIYGDNRKESVSSSVSKHKPRTMSELNICLHACLNEQAPVEKLLTETNTEEILVQNIKSLNQNIFDWFNLESIGFPKVSNLMTISTCYSQYFQNIPKQPLYSPQLLASMILNNPPLPGKSRYYTAKDISNRLNSALRALNVRKSISVSKLSVNNVFLFTPS